MDMLGQSTYNNSIRSAKLPFEKGFTSLYYYQQIKNASFSLFQHLLYQFLNCYNYQFLDFTKFGRI